LEKLACTALPQPKKPKKQPTETKPRKQPPPSLNHPGNALQQPKKKEIIFEV